MPKVDTDLARQLANAPADQLIEAVVTLRVPEEARYLEPRQTRATVDEVLARVAEGVQASPSKVTIFQNLGRFFLLAPAAFVKSVIEQPEVSSAAANKPDGR